MADSRFHSETVDYLNLAKKYSLWSSSAERTPERARQDPTIVVSDKAAYDGTIRDVTIPSVYSPDGIPATVYVPSSKPDDTAVLVYFHGGGMVIGSRAGVDSCCRQLSLQAPCVVVSVEYRLAPEHKFPACFEDGETATNWVVKNKTIVGGSERSPVGIGGDSAGGSIAATVAHQVPGLAFQILVYPRVNFRAGPVRKSAIEYKDGPLFTQSISKWFHGHFLRTNADREDILLNPYFRETFNHLPPALMVVAEFDLLRDDSYDYQTKLKEAGVRAEVFQVDGAIHIFFTKPEVFKECCTKAYKRVTDFIREIAYSQP